MKEIKKVLTKGHVQNLSLQKQIKRFLYREHFYPEVKPDTEDYDYVRDHAGTFSFFSLFFSLVFLHLLWIGLPR